MYELTYSNLELNAFDIRISSISEKDDYTIEVDEAQEEATGIYDLTYYGDDTTTIHHCLLHSLMLPHPLSGLWQ